MCTAGVKAAGRSSDARENQAMPQAMTFFPAGVQCNTSPLRNPLPCAVDRCRPLWERFEGDQGAWHGTPSRGGVRPQRRTGPTAKFVGERAAGVLGEHVAPQEGALDDTLRAHRQEAVMPAFAGP